jgi:hypothetical protein
VGIFYFRYLRDYDISLSPSDIVPLNYAYKKMREIFRRMPSYRGEIAVNHPIFPEGSAAVCGKTLGPVDFNAPDIIYTAEDDQAIDKYHRDTGMSEHGTPFITENTESYHSQHHLALSSCS